MITKIDLKLLFSKETGKQWENSSKKYKYDWLESKLLQELNNKNNDRE